MKGKLMKGKLMKGKLMKRQGDKLTSLYNRLVDEMVR